MKAPLVTQVEALKQQIDQRISLETISSLVKQSFKMIAPFWPLKNLVAVNPLHGLEDFPIEEALTRGAVYFEQSDIPKPMSAVNRETIKWLQAYCDDGQATIQMPLRSLGLYTAWRKLAIYDAKLHGFNTQKQEFLRTLAESSETAIADCLLSLDIAKEDDELFLSLMLSTLPGWASYIKYRTEWGGLETAHPYPITQADYIAIRLIITYLFWPEAKLLVEQHRSCQKKVKVNTLSQIQKLESQYYPPLLRKLATQAIQTSAKPEAQLVFCIDVRSEPFRRALESTCHYETFGFAGFFGIPIQVTDLVTSESYTSCPVLLSPLHHVKESPCSAADYESDSRGYARLSAFKRLYQSLKYTFTTPFAMVESLGMISGVWMGLRCLTPKLAGHLKTLVIQTIRKPINVEASLDNLSLVAQCSYAEAALSMIGLVEHFAPLVVLCGHGSTTQNNAFATALDCGACGGRHGASNARLLATILNCPVVRAELLKKSIVIPKNTLFIAAKHNTTSDEVTLYGDQDSSAIQKLKQDLETARSLNSSVRLSQMGKRCSTLNSASHTLRRCHDWAQVRPEWGLARNSAFIVAPRSISSSLDLEGRCFLHSYDYSKDPEGKSLSTILTAPMVVAQWINNQYLFSTLDNVAYGSGSKITKNITGKIGVMQGNASDLMTGLPLQSVYSSDTDAYHEPLRLMTIVYAPCQMLDSIIKAQPILQKLFGNGWVHLACIEPDDREIRLLNRDFTWQEMH